MEIDQKGIGERIEVIRKRMGFTQQELARALGITQSAVSKYLNNRIPPADVLFRLAQLGKTTMEWILCGEKSYWYASEATAVREEEIAYDADLGLARQIARLPRPAREALVTLVHLLNQQTDNKL